MAFVLPGPSATTLAAARRREEMVDPAATTPCGRTAGTTGGARRARRLIAAVSLTALAACAEDPWTPAGGDGGTPREQVVDVSGGRAAQQPAGRAERPSGDPGGGGRAAGPAAPSGNPGGGQGADDPGNGGGEPTTAGNAPAGTQVASGDDRDQTDYPGPHGTAAGPGPKPDSPSGPRGLRAADPVRADPGRDQLRAP